MKRLFFYFILISFAIAGCENSKLSCYNSELKDLMLISDYKEIMQSAKKQVTLLKEETGQSLYKQDSYIDSAILDESVFFNAAKNKCILLLLRQTVKDLYLDNILIIQGTKHNEKWSFNLDRLPEVPNIKFTIDKSGPRSNAVNNSFDKLSKEGRLFVLTAGTVSNFGCEIDEKYWFGSE